VAISGPMLTLSRNETPGRLPRFIHALTAIHGIGALACFIMAGGSAWSDTFRTELGVSGGSRLMLRLFGQSTWIFLTGVGLVLFVLAYGSLRVRPWAWYMTLIVYCIGVVGSLWQVSLGIRPGWISAAVNSAVVIYVSRHSVRRAYLGVDAATPSERG
jgi:hypothetical protein